MWRLFKNPDKIKNRHRRINIQYLNNTMKYNEIAVSSSPLTDCPKFGNSSDASY